MQGQLDLCFGQVQLEPHLSTGQVKFTNFCLTLIMSTNKFCFVKWVILIFPLELTLLRGMCSVSWFVSEA